jgi:hypothetical protein
MSPEVKQALCIARELREEFRGSGEFTQECYLAELAVKLKDFKKKAFDGFVQHIGQIVDRQSHSAESRPDGQLYLFDVEGEYKLGDSRRIAKRLARIDHADAAMALDDRNAAAVLMANARKREELTRLRPYWSNGKTKEQAVEAYFEANPGDSTVA